jgi:hypothetical protein
VIFDQARPHFEGEANGKNENTDSFKFIILRRENRPKDAADERNEREQPRGRSELVLKRDGRSSFERKIENNTTQRRLLDRVSRQFRCAPLLRALLARGKLG